MLEIKQLNVSYGKQKVLRDVGFSLQEREVVALIGSNAAGKSTTLRTIAGLKKADSGTINFGGKEISSLPTVERVQSGLVLVPEGRQIFPRLTVHENLLMGAFTRGDDVSREVDAVYDRFPNLARRKDRPATSHWRRPSDCPTARCRATARA